MAKINIIAKQKKAIGVVLVAMIIMVGFLVLGRMVFRDGEDGGADTQLTIEDVQVRAAEYFGGGDIDGGLSYYDEQIKMAEKNDEKRVLLTHKSSLALMGGQHQVAIDSARQADEIGSTDKTVKALAEAYMASGNKEQALVYYRKLLAISPDNGSDLRRGPSLEDTIKGLEQ